MTVADAEPGSSRHRPLLVLSKITDILDAFSLAKPELTLGEIQRATGNPTSTVQRLVSNMVAEGMLDRHGDRIRVGVRMAYRAAPAAHGIDVLELVTPVLRELRDETGESACFFREEQGQRVCVALAETSLAGPLPSFTDATITDPAELRRLVDQARRDGYAVTVAERDDGASGLAAPVFDSSTELVGALAISGPTIRLPRERCEGWVDLLVAQAERVIRTLGGRRPA